MNYELFIARKLFFSKEKTEKQEGRRMTNSITRLSVGGIAISLIVMIIAVGVVIGFKQEVRNKIIGFGSHIQISASFTNQTYETHPIQFDSTLIDALQKNPYVHHVQQVGVQPGILKVNDSFHGILLKGIDKNYDWDFFKKNIKAGTIPSITDTATCNDILISQKVADMFQLKIGDKAHVYFVIDRKARVRAMTVKGIYTTGYSDYDNLLVIGDIQHIRKLNGWEKDQCSDLEIEIKDFNALDEAINSIYPIVGNRFDKNGNYYMIKGIKDINPQIFGWLDLLDMNVVIIFILMIAVACFTIISGLLILVLDRTNMIGILKAMGANNGSVQRMFLYISLFIVGKGMIIGNCLGLVLCFIQKQFNILKLNADIYYVDAVPIELSWMNVLLINIGVFAISALVLRLSTCIITKISPTKAIRFE